MCNGPAHYYYSRAANLQRNPSPSKVEIRELEHFLDISSCELPESPSSRYAESAVDKINQCKEFCERVAETAAMHSPALTDTECNLARLLQQAMAEIRQQLDCLEADVALSLSPRTSLVAAATK